MSAFGGKADARELLAICPLIATDIAMPVAEAVRGIRFVMFTDTKWKKSHSTCPGCKDAAMQVSHQRRRHNANSTWPEYRQQFNSGAPALNSLISSDVSAHATSIGFHKRGGKVLGNGFGLIPGVLGGPVRPGANLPIVQASG